MKSALNKYIFLALTTAITIQFQTANALPKKETSHLFSESTLKSIKNETEYLATIANNAQLLVHQIQKNEINEADRKKSLKNIHVALQKLSTTTQQEINEQISLIIQESHSFAAQRHPLKKYNNTLAENALENLVFTIQRLVENMSEVLVIEIQEKLIDAINTAELIKKEANFVINKTHEQLAQGTITPIDAAKAIGEQNHKVSAAQRVLTNQTQHAKNIFLQNDIQTNTFNHLITNIYHMGSYIIAPFKSGYGYTDEEKDMAYAIIAQLEEQLALETQRYNMKLKQPLYAKNPQKSAELTHQFQISTQAIYNEIHKQQLITGQTMSTSRKLFWGAMAIAGIVSTGLIGYNYFSSPQEITPLAVEATPTIFTIETTAQPQTQQENQETLNIQEELEEHNPIESRQETRIDETRTNTDTQEFANSTSDDTDFDEDTPPATSTNVSRDTSEQEDIIEQQSSIDGVNLPLEINQINAEVQKTNPIISAEETLTHDSIANTDTSFKSDDKDFDEDTPPAASAHLTNDTSIIEEQEEIIEPQYSFDELNSIAAIKNEQNKLEKETEQIQKETDTSAAQIEQNKAATQAAKDEENRLTAQTQQIDHEIDGLVAQIEQSNTAAHIAKDKENKLNTQAQQTQRETNELIAQTEENNAAIQSAKNTFAAKKETKQIQEETDTLAAQIEQNNAATQAAKDEENRLATQTQQIHHDIDELSAQIEQSNATAHIANDEKNKLNTQAQQIQRETNKLTSQIEENNAAIQSAQNTLAAKVAQQKSDELAFQAEQNKAAKQETLQPEKLDTATQAQPESEELNWAQKIFGKPTEAEIKLLKTLGLKSEITHINLLPQLLSNAQKLTADNMGEPLHQPETTE